MRLPVTAPADMLLVCWMFSGAARRGEARRVDAPICPSLAHEEKVQKGVYRDLFDAAAELFHARLLRARSRCASI